MPKRRSPQQQWKHEENRQDRSDHATNNHPGERLLGLRADSV
jgi:hypothetical protein